MVIKTTDSLFSLHLMLDLLNLSFFPNLIFCKHELGRYFSFFTYLVGWLVCCLLAGLDLRKRMPLMCSITMVFTCPLLSCYTISTLFRENNNVVVFPFSFHNFIVQQLVVLPPSRIVHYPKYKKLH